MPPAGDPQLIPTIIRNLQTLGINEWEIMSGHIEPFASRLKLRYRIDGVLQEAEAPPAHLTSAVVSRVKIMAKRTIDPSLPKVDLIGYLQKIAEEKLNAGDRKGSLKEFFTVTNDGREASKAYMVTWRMNNDGSAVITVTDQI